MFEGKTRCVMNSVRKTGNNKNMRWDAQRNSIQDKPLSAANVRTTESREPRVQLMWIIINIANYKYCNKIYHLSVVKLARHFQLSVMIFKIAHPWLSWGRKIIWCNRLKKSEMLRICCNSTMTPVLRSHSKHICYTHSAVRALGLKILLFTFADSDLFLPCVIFSQNEWKH